MTCRLCLTSCKLAGHARCVAASCRPWGDTACVICAPGFHGRCSTADHPGPETPRSSINQALAQVTGEAVYTDDLPPTTGLLHAALVKSARPHARILSLDTSLALQVPRLLPPMCGRMLPPFSEGKQRLFAALCPA